MVADQCGAEFVFGCLVLAERVVVGEVPEAVIEVADAAVGGCRGGLVVAHADHGTGAGRRLRDPLRCDNVNNT